MAFITESELREQWKGGSARFEFPAGTRFSPSALDFIKEWQLNVIVGGEPVVATGPRVHHYSEDLAPGSMARATERRGQAGA
jgi:ethanolamine utilization cobalamin adenosyltransferase